MVQLNPRYVPQLEAVLAWPQSIGVVGGRPSSSLYFVGWQAAPTHTQQHQNRQQQNRQQQPHAPPAEHHGQQLKNDAVAAAPMVCKPAPAAPVAVTPGEEQQPRQQLKQQQASQPKQQGAQGRESTAAVGGVAGSSVIYLDPHQVQEVRQCVCSAPSVVAGSGQRPALTASSRKVRHALFASAAATLGSLLCGAGTASRSSTLPRPAAAPAAPSVVGSPGRPLGGSALEPGSPPLPCPATCRAGRLQRRRLADVPLRGAAQHGPGLHRPIPGTGLLLW